MRRPRDARRKEISGNSQKSSRGINRRCCPRNEESSVISDKLLTPCVCVVKYESCDLVNFARIISGDSRLDLSK